MSALSQPKCKRSAKILGAPTTGLNVDNVDKPFLSSTLIIPRRLITHFSWFATCGDLPLAKLRELTKVSTCIIFVFTNLSQTALQYPLEIGVASGLRQSGKLLPLSWHSRPLQRTLAHKWRVIERALRAAEMNHRRPMLQVSTDH